MLAIVSRVAGRIASQSTKDRIRKDEVQARKDEQAPTTIMTTTKVVSVGAGSSQTRQRRVSFHDEEVPKVSLHSSLHIPFRILNSVLPNPNRIYHYFY